MAKITSVAILLALAVAVSGFEGSITSYMNPFLRNVNRAPANIPRSIVENTVTQRVDNFDPQNQATYEQRYFMNGEFFQPDGPIIILVGGFNAISLERLEASMPLNLARELFGYVFYLEHRYYGESFPTEDLSDANLRFLTPDQALADLAHFVSHIKSSVVTPGAENSPVIVVGSTYGGSLAAWFRQKYPHLALAAWASSAPMLSLVNQHHYKETAAATFRSIGGDECYNALEASFTYLEEQVQAGNLDQLSSIFNLCENSLLGTERSISLFFTVLAEIFSIVPQIGTTSSIFGTCQIMQTPAETPAHNIQNVFEFIGNNDESESNNCINLDYNTVIDLERETQLDSFAASFGARQYTYITCTQLGWHHTSDSPNQPFGNRFPLDFSLEFCESIFGDVFSNFTLHATSDRHNVAHGGLNPRVTNVIFTHGELDPTRTIGVLEALNEDAPVFITPDANQAADLTAISETESEELTNTKITVKNLLRTWIARDQGIAISPF